MHAHSANLAGRRWLVTHAPGVGLAFAVAAAAYALSRTNPVISPLIVAIIAGVLLTNTVGVPPALGPGITFSSKVLLRAGIILLGLRLVLTDIIDLGWPTLLLVIVAVATGLVATLVFGRLLGLGSNLSLLIACGFSICGAAAVAGAAGVLDPDEKNEQDTVTAVALVVIFGTIMIPLVPLLASVLDLTAHQGGLWAGASVHEIAQVVAIGGIIGGGALTIAIVVKLARVLLLAPIVTVLAVKVRRDYRASRDKAGGDVRIKLPPVVPPFIVAFLAVVLLRTYVDLPAGLLDVGLAAQSILLAAAMFGLGCGVNVRKLAGVGAAPFIVAGLSTLVMLTIGLGGALIIAT